jgi:hypothetical protein
MCKVLSGIIIFFYLISSYALEEDSFLVKAKFLDSGIKYLSPLAEFKLNQMKCDKDEVSQRVSKWSCHHKAETTICQSRFICKRPSKIGSKEHYISGLKKEIKTYKHLKGKGEIRLHFKTVKRLPLLVSMDEPKRECKNNICLRNLQLSTISVQDDTKSSLITTNLSWIPNYTFNNNFRINTKLGAHNLVTKTEETFLVLEYGLSLEYLYGQSSLLIGTGTQMWNNSKSENKNYIEAALSYIPKSNIFNFINRIGLSYTRIDSFNNINDVRFNLGIEF